MNEKESLRVREEFRAEFARHRERSHPAEFPRLPDLPAGRYTDARFADLERKHVWSKSWLLAGHQDEVPERGSYKLWRHAGAPVLLVRGEDGDVRGFYNTCRHRGGPLVRSESGKTKTLLCKYHCWNYDLTGALRHVPDEHEFPGLDKAERALVPVPVALWGNWIFVSLAADPEPLEDFFGPVIRELSDFRPERLRFVERHYFDIACNWKVAMDAFQEVYHLKHIHPETVNKMLDHRGATMALYPKGHSRMIVPNRPGRDELPMDAQGARDGADDPEHAITRESSRSYNLFPNVVTPTSELEFPFLVFWPAGLGRTRMEVVWWGQPDDCDSTTEEWKMRLAAFDVVLGEDVANLGWIQESLESPGFSSVPLSYQERRIYAHHEEIDRRIGRENVPHGLSIPDLLSPWFET